MLSAYIDGELDASDADMITQHLASCSSCAHECESLQRAATVLSQVPEIEPPQFLMGRIEAATVNRVPAWQRLRAAFSLPRWVAATAVATTVLVGFLAFQSGMKDASVTPVPVAKAPVPSDSQQIDTSVSVEIAEVSPGQSSSAIGLSSGRRISKAQSSKNVPAVQHRLPSGSGPAVAENKERAPLPQPAEDIVVEGPVHPNASQPDIVVAEAPQPAGETVVEVLPSPVGREFKIAAPPTTDISTKIRQNADALERLREQIAASNRSRPYRSTTAEGMERRVYSVELANIRF